jgi:FdhD protein
MARWPRGDDAAPERAEDCLAVEEPLEIRLGDEPVAVVMRTPGDDLALALGFLFTEGILRRPEQLLSVAFCTDTRPGAEGNVVRVLAEGADRDAFESARRRVYASSSCGICGKSTLDAVRLLAPEPRPAPPLRRTLALDLPAKLRAAQRLFDATGGLHAAGLFSFDGELLRVAEDVGRHNAVDKVLGAMVLAETWPLPDRVLVLSGRASFEMVQKAAMAGIPAVVAVSAPSSLAVDFAAQRSMTLLGFAREGSVNVYSGEVVP